MRRPPAAAALRGGLGIVASGLMVFVLRQTSSDERWPGIEKYIKVAFWGTNIGLLMMVGLSLFPSGVLQIWDVVQNGYWHARSLAYTGGSLPRLFEWLRLPADLIFILLGALPILLAVGLGYLGLWRRQEPSGAIRSALAK